MDLHRIPDDLSIPEFLKRDRRIRSDYELDDVESRDLIRTWEKALAKDEAKRKKRQHHPKNSRRCNPRPKGEPRPC
jgi:hypothetical protein